MNNTRKVNAKVNLLSHQHEFIHSEAQYPALIGGFGSGKTEAAIFRALSFIFVWGPLFKARGEKYYYGIYEPTYDLIKLIMYPRFEEILSMYGIKYNLNKTNKILEIGDHSVIIFRSMENPERIVGYEHADCGLDELDTLTKDKANEVFNKVIARNRLKKPNGGLNTCSITTTPEGYRFCYEKWEKTDKPEKFVIIRGKTINNIYLTEQYIEDLRSQYPANLIEAYLNGMFVNLKNNPVYTNFDKELNDTRERLTDTDKVIHIGMDFNVGKMSAIIAKIINNSVYIVDEIHGALDTPEMIRIIKERFPNKQIMLYADAAGNARKSVDASTSDIALLRNAGFIIKNGGKNPFVKDRVMSVQALFCNMDERRRLFINTSICKILTDNLLQQVYTQAGEPDKSSGNDHMIDALGYLVWVLAPVKKMLFNKNNVKKPY